MLTPSTLFVLPGRWTVQTEPRLEWKWKFVSSITMKSNHTNHKGSTTTDSFQDDTNNNNNFFYFVISLTPLAEMGPTQEDGEDNSQHPDQLLVRQKGVLSPLYRFMFKKDASDKISRQKMKERSTKMIDLLYVRLPS